MQKSSVVLQRDPIFPWLLRSSLQRSQIIMNIPQVGEDESFRGRQQLVPLPLSKKELRQRGLKKVSGHLKDEQNEEL